MAETNNPDIRLHIGADVVPSKNTIEHDLQTAFNRSPLRIDFGVKDSSKNRIRTEIQQIMSANPIKLPVQISRAGVDFTALQKEFQSLSSRISKLDVDTTPYQKRLRSLGSLQRKLLTLDPDTDEYNKALNSYLRTIQKLQQELDAATRTSSANNTFVGQKNFLSRVEAVESYKRQIEALNGDTSELQALLASVENNIEKTRAALTTKGARTIFSEATEDMALLEKKLKDAQRLQRQGGGSGNSGGSGGDGGGDGGEDEFNPTQSVAFRNMQSDISEARRQLDLLNGDTAELSILLEQVETEMDAAVDATDIQDFQKHWDEARVALHSYRIELSQFQTGGSDAAKSTKLHQQVQEQIRGYGRLVTVFNALDHPTQELTQAFVALGNAERDLEQGSPDADTAWIQQQLSLVRQLQKEYEKLLRAQTSGRAINAETFLGSKAYVGRAAQVDKLREQLTQLGPFAEDALEVSTALAQLDQHMNNLHDATAPIEAINEEMAAGAVVIQRVTELVGRLETRYAHLSLADSLGQNQKLFEEETEAFNSLQKPSLALGDAYKALKDAQDALMQGAPTNGDKWIQRQLALIEQLRKEYKKLFDDYIAGKSDDPAVYRSSKKVLSHENTVNDTIRTLEALKNTGYQVDVLDQNILELQDHLRKMQQSSTVDAVNEELHEGEALLQRILALVDQYKRTDVLESARIDISTESHKFEEYLQTISPKAHQVYAEQIATIRGMFNAIPDNAEAAQTHLEKIKKLVREFGAECKHSGYDGGNAIEFITRKMKEYGTYLVSSLLTDGVYRVFSQIIENVKSLDAALVNIRMVTGDNVSVAKELLYVYNDIAKELGASTVDVSESAVEWLRQGYSESDTNDLIRDSMVLAKVGFMDNTEAAQALTAAMKGYGIAAADAMSIVDKFTQVDQIAATSAGNLATALSKTAANAKVAGLELDEVIGYLAVVNETLQEDAESTGTFMNTMLSRMGNIKAGRLVDPETEESLSDVETTLRRLGIQLRSSDDQFRDFGEVLAEVGANWKNYSSVQQRAIAVAFAGTRQQTRFLTLMENFTQAQGYITAAAESGGSALEKFSAQEDSIEFKTRRVTAAFEELSSNLLNSKMLSGLSDVGFGVLEFLNIGDGAIAKLTLLIPLIIGLSTAFEALKQSSVGVRIQNIIDGFRETGSVAGAASKGVQTFVGAFNSNKLLSWGTLATTVISAVIGVVQAWRRSLEEAVAEAKEAADSIEESEDSLRGYLEQAAQLNHRLQTQNLSLAETRDAHSELFDIQEKVVALLGEEAEGFDVLAVNAENAAETIRLYNQVAAEEWLMKHGKGINEATRWMEKSRWQGVDTSYQKIGEGAAAQQVSDQLASRLTEYISADPILSGAIAYTQKAAGENQTSYILTLEGVIGDGSYAEIDRALQDLYKYINQQEDYYHVDLSALKQSVSVAINEVENELDEHSDYVDTYNKSIEFKLLDSYSSFYDQYEAIQSGIQNAGAENNVADLARLQNALVSLMNTASADDAFLPSDKHVQTSFMHMLADLQAQLQKYSLKINLSDFAIDEGALKTGVATVQAAFNAEDGIQNIDAWNSIVDVYEKVKLAQSQGRTLTAKQVGLTNEQYMALHILETILAQYGLTLGAVNTDIDLQNEILGVNTEMLSDEEYAFDTLRQKLQETETEYSTLQQLMASIDGGSIGMFLAGDEAALDRLEDIKKTYPEIYQALMDYAEGLISVDDLHRVVFNVSSTTFLGDLSDAYEDVYKAAHEYGWESWQVQSAMNAMSAVMPSLRAALYNHENGMWDVSEAALEAALSTDILRDALLNLFNTTYTSRQSEIDNIIGQLNNTTNEVQQAALTEKLNTLLAQQKADEAQVNSFLEQWETGLATIREDVRTSGSGGSSKSIYEKMKEELDKYLESEQHHIDMLERQIELESRVSTDHADEATSRLDNLNDTISSYRDMQAAVKSLITEYENMGLTDESRRIIMELEDMWWEYEEAIVSAADGVISALDGLTEETTSAIDSLQDAYQTLRGAAEEYAANGFITVDTLQAIIGLGVEYLSYLQNENGQLVINADNIEKVLAAKTQQLAVDTALNYVKKLGIALEMQDSAMLNQLLTATSATTSATWDLVYAQLALLDLDSTQYQQALNNINALRSLAENTNTTLAANTGNASASNYYDDTSDALQKVLDLTMDLIRHENEEMVDALEKQKDLYKEIIDLKKESLQEEADEEDYGRELEDRLDEISDLQSRIDMLSLDTSREATAERLALEEELAEKQADLADFQAEHALDAQLDALDDEYESYEQTKDKEIEATKNAVSSTEKIYQQAIARINNDWNGLYQDLLAWNAEYGSTLQQDLVEAWGKASEAVQRYGSYVAAVNGVANQTGASSVVSGSGDYQTSGSSGNTGEEPGSTIWYYDDIDPATYSTVKTLVDKMKANSQAWLNASDSERQMLQADNEYYASRIESLTGKQVARDLNGVWWIDGEELYEKFKYHTGGIVGNQPSLKQNEVLALLEKDEMVLDAKKQQGAYRLLDFMNELSQVMTTKLSTFDFAKYLNIPMTYMPTTPTVGAPRTEVNWHPEIHVAISHNGSLSDADARRYGQTIANTALSDLKEAFTRKGVSAFNPLKA